jgi:hypothetical protein
LALVLAAAVARGSDGPRLVLRESVFEFGAVERGTEVVHVFGLPNRGGADLRIDHVKTSCGCTVAVLSDQMIPPGSEARVAVTLDTARLAGRTTKTVSVYTNDPAAPVVGLSLTGQVNTDLVVNPTPLYLGRVRRGDPVRREVLITPGREGAPYVVERIEPGTRGLRTRLEPRAEGPGQRLVVELDRSVPLGHFNETLSLHTTSPHDSVITLPVLANVEGDVIVLPPQVTFGVTRGGGAAERDVYVRNRGLRPITITRVVVPDKVATWTLDPVQAGQEYRITVRLRENLPPGKVETTVEIFTDHPDEDHLVVPLYAIVRDGQRRS